MKNIGSVKGFVPKQPLHTSVRNISMISAGITQNDSLSADALVFKEDVNNASAEFLLLLLESLRQLSFPAGSNRTSNQNNFTVIRNNIYNIVNNYKNIVSYSDNSRLKAILEHAGIIFSPYNSTLSRYDISTITGNVVNELAELAKSPQTSYTEQINKTLKNIGLKKNYNDLNLLKWFDISKYSFNKSNHISSFFLNDNGLNINASALFSENKYNLVFNDTTNDSKYQSPENKHSLLNYISNKQIFSYNTETDNDTVHSHENVNNSENISIASLRKSFEKTSVNSATNLSGNSSVNLSEILTTSSSENLTVSSSENSTSSSFENLTSSSFENLTVSSSENSTSSSSENLTISSSDNSSFSSFYNTYINPYDNSSIVLSEELAMISSANSFKNSLIYSSNKTKNQYTSLTNNYSFSKHLILSKELMSSYDFEAKHSLATVQENARTSPYINSILLLNKNDSTSFESSEKLLLYRDKNIKNEGSSSQNEYSELILNHISEVIESTYNLKSQNNFDFHHGIVSLSEINSGLSFFYRNANIHSNLKNKLHYLNNFSESFMLSYNELMKNNLNIIQEAINTYGIYSNKTIPNSDENTLEDAIEINKNSSKTKYRELNYRNERLIPSYSFPSKNSFDSTNSYIYIHEKMDIDYIDSNELFVDLSEFYANRINKKYEKLNIQSKKLTSFYNSGLENIYIHQDRSTNIHKEDYNSLFNSTNDYSVENSTNEFNRLSGINSAENLNSFSNSESKLYSKQIIIVRNFISQLAKLNHSNFLNNSYAEHYTDIFNYANSSLENFVKIINGGLFNSISKTLLSFSGFYHENRNMLDSYKGFIGKEAHTIADSINQAAYAHKASVSSIMGVKNDNEISIVESFVITYTQSPDRIAFDRLNVKSNEFKNKINYFSAAHINSRNRNDFSITNYEFTDSPYLIHNNVYHKNNLVEKISNSNYIENLHETQNSSFIHIEAKNKAFLIKIPSRFTASKELYLNSIKSIILHNSITEQLHSGYYKDYIYKLFSEKMNKANLLNSYESDIGFNYSFFSDVNMYHEVKTQNYTENPRITYELPDYYNYKMFYETSIMDRKANNYEYLKNVENTSDTANKSVKNQYNTIDSSTNQSVNKHFVESGSVIFAYRNSIAYKIFDVFNFRAKGENLHTEHFNTINNSSNDSLGSELNKTENTYDDVVLNSSLYLSGAAQLFKKISLISDNETSKLYPNKEVYSFFNNSEPVFNKFKKASLLLKFLNDKPAVTYTMQNSASLYIETFHELVLHFFENNPVSANLMLFSDSKDNLYTGVTEHTLNTFSSDVLNNNNNNNNNMFSNKNNSRADIIAKNNSIFILSHIINNKNKLNHSDMQYFSLNDKQSNKRYWEDLSINVNQSLFSYISNINQTGVPPRNSQVFRIRVNEQIKPEISYNFEAINQTMTQLQTYNRIKYINGSPTENTTLRIMDSTLNKNDFDKVFLITRKYNDFFMSNIALREGVINSLKLYSTNYQDSVNSADDDSFSNTNYIFSNTENIKHLRAYRNEFEPKTISVSNNKTDYDTDKLSYYKFLNSVASDNHFLVSNIKANGEISFLILNKSGNPQFLNISKTNTPDTNATLAPRPYSDYKNIISKDKNQFRTIEYNELIKLTKYNNDNILNRNVFGFQSNKYNEEETFKLLLAGLSDVIYYYNSQSSRRMDTADVVNKVLSPVNSSFSPFFYEDFNLYSDLPAINSELAFFAVSEELNFFGKKINNNNNKKFYNFLSKNESKTNHPQHFGDTEKKYVNSFNLENNFTFTKLIDSSYKSINSLDNQNISSHNNSEINKSNANYLSKFESQSDLVNFITNIVTQIDNNKKVENNNTYNMQDIDFISSRVIDKIEARIRTQNRLRGK